MRNGKSREMSQGPHAFLPDLRTIFLRNVQGERNKERQKAKNQTLKRSIMPWLDDRDV